MLPVGKSCWLLSFGGTKKIRGAPKLSKDRLCPAAGQRTHWFGDFASLRKLASSELSRQLFLLFWVGDVCDCRSRKTMGQCSNPCWLIWLMIFSVIGHTITTLSIGDDHNSWTGNPVLNQAVFVYHCFSCLFPVNCAPLQVPLQEWQWWNQVLDLLEVHNEPVIPSHLRRTRTSPKDWTDGTGDWSPAIFSLEKYTKIRGWTGQCSGSKGYSIFRGTHQE